MAWINTIALSEASGKLQKLYQRVAGPDGQIDNILKAHSLRPHTLTGHMTLYKNVLHHADNTLPKWYLESVGVYVSLINQCEYCVVHHKAGLCRLIGDDRGNAIVAALESDEWPSSEESRFAAGIQYASKLSRSPGKMREDDLAPLRTAGFDDGAILELNQVIAYFNYANRTVLGLGVSFAGEVLGLSPSDESDEENWCHQKPVE